MADQEQSAPSISNINFRAGTFALACVVMFAATIMAAPAVQAQTLTVLHTFMGEADGATPIAGLTKDAAGTLYGTAEFGGLFQSCSASSCGTVYKVVRRGSIWLTTPIYSFKGAPDGATPTSRVIFGPDGALYGTTMLGGTGSCVSTVSGCGTVFKLQPPATVCKSALCPWRETVLYSFASQTDGENPRAEIVFDQAGNLYGTTYLGGTGPCNDGLYTGCGTVFKLTHNSDGTWSKSTLYSFQNGPNDGGFPYAGVTLDQAGNIYGTTYAGGTDCTVHDVACGVVFELTPSGSGWTEIVLHFFSGGTDGNYPYGGLIFDSLGNLYGAAGGGGLGQGTVYELSPAQGGWSFAVLHSFGQEEADGPASKLTMDAAGSLYGSSFGGGTFGAGTVYKLAPSSGGWIYSTLHSFGFGSGSDGFGLNGSVVLDAAGNVYGTASEGPYPSPDAGTVFEITP